MYSDPTFMKHPPEQRFFLLARVAMLVLLVTLFALGLDFPGPSSTIWMYLFLTLVVGVVSLVALLEMRVGEDAFRSSLLWLVGPDLFCVAGFTFLFHDMEDAFYPVAILLPVLYALVLPRERAWTVSGLSMAAYLVGHYSAHDLQTFSEMFLYAIKAAAIPTVGVAIAVSVDRQKQRSAEALAAAAERAQLNAELERRLSELQAVSQITEIIHSSLEFDRIGPLVIEILAKVIAVDTCCLFVIDKDESETLFSASAGAVTSDAGYERPELATIASDEHFSCMPVFDHQNLMVMFCASAEAIAALSPEDRIVLSAVSSELIVGVENSRLYKLTKRLAVTDELTSLYNYRYLQQRIDEEVERARRYGKRVSLLMLDADDFKSFNDTQGHIAGDVAIAELARVIESVVREVDVVARYGGEEFSVLLPETDAAGAYVVAEKVREAVAVHTFPDAGGERICHLTVSIGLATFPTHAWDKESLLRESDDALYQAKHGGKDRVRTPKRREAPDATPADDDDQAELPEAHAHTNGAD